MVQDIPDQEYDNMYVYGSGMEDNTYLKKQIDCGSCYSGGRLAAICLDTGEEFYLFSNEMGGRKT